jgi:transcription elongation factor Elf1
MSYLDEKYAMLVSSKLLKFKKSGKVYNFRCPYCLDSEKSKTKRRGYLYGTASIPNLCYKCHNCGVSVSFGTLLKHVDQDLYNSYVMEKYRDGAGGRSSHKQVEQFPLPKAPTQTNVVGLPSMYDLPDGHPHKEYIRARRIPSQHYKEIYFAEDFKEWAKGRIPDDKYKTLKENDARILFPFRAPDKHIIGGQGRIIQKDGLRYVTFKTNELEELIYGLDRVDPTKLVYVVEGPIDSLFIPNCIAAAGSDLAGSVTRIRRYMDIPDENIVLIYDNEPRNKQIVELMEKGVAKYKVVIWAQGTHEKDINDMVLSGLTPTELFAIIQKRTFGGLSAKLEFNSWKMC